MPKHDVDPHEELILFSDKRQREHRRRQSVIAIDDTDVLLHKRATRRSILYGGDSQGPKFWNQLKSVVLNNSNNVIPPPAKSPTSVRDMQQIDDQHAVFDSNPQGVFCDELYGEVEDFKVTHYLDTSQSATSTKRTSTTSTVCSSTGSMDSSSQSHHVSSVWDRLDALSLKEHRQVQDYHDTVQQQNERIAAVSMTVDGSSLPIVNSQVGTSTVTTTPNAIAPHFLRGRLRRQNSWNGRDSTRDLIQARGSVRAEVEDGSFRDLFCCDDDDDEVQSAINDKKLNDKVDDTKSLLSGTRFAGGGSMAVPTSKPSEKKKLNRNNADQNVLNLIM